MKTCMIPVAIDEALVPLIDELTEANDVPCASSFLSLLMTRALLQARERALLEAQTTIDASAGDDEPIH
jgi:hypothetical protein